MYFSLRQKKNTIHGNLEKDFREYSILYDRSESLW